MKNNSEGIHFSKIAGLLPTTLLKMNSFAGSFELFSNIYFAEKVTLATPKNISYRNIKNDRSSHRKLFFLFDFTLFWFRVEP